MASAAFRLFHIAELSEQILHEVNALEDSAKRLFVLQRVNHAFRSTINSSAQLLQAMGVQHSQRKLQYPPMAADALNPIFHELWVHPQAKLTSVLWRDPYCTKPAKQSTSYVGMTNSARSPLERYHPHFRPPSGLGGGIRLPKYRLGKTKARLDCDDCLPRDLETSEARTDAGAD